MINFQTWKILKLFEATKTEVSGPGIQALQRMFNDMAARGAPREYNDYGFNKQDWEAYQRLSMSGHLTSESVPVQVATTMLSILSHYRNTQITNYEEISGLVRQDFAKIAQSGHDQDKVVVFDRQPAEYGKTKVYIPHGIDRSMTIQINRIVDAAFQEEGAEKEQDNYGNYKYPRFKKFSADRSSLHTYRVHRNILSKVVDFLKSKGLEVTYESGGQPDQQAPPTSGATPPTGQQPPREDKPQEIEIIGIEEGQYGKKLAIRFAVPFDRSRATFEALKRAGLSPRGIAYASGPSRFLINIADRSMFDTVKKEIAKTGMDVTPLDEFEKKHFGEGPAKEQPQQTAGNNSDLVSFEDQPEDKMKVKVNYRALNTGKKEFLKESIQYTFPQYEWLRDEYAYLVGGNYKQYVAFGRLLKKFGYNVDKLRAIVQSKLEKGDLKKTDWEGQHDDDADFHGKIEERLPESKFDLYDEQKKGVAFLYGRDHAILGDETGLGKCISPNSYVQTSYGAFKIKNLWDKYATDIIVTDKGEEWAKCPDDLYVHSMDENGKTVKGKVISLYREKIKSSLKEITTSNGKKISATLPHKFYTLNGWKSEITVNDYVCSSPNQFALEVNDFNDLNLTKLIAWQISEGWESNKRSTFSITQNEKCVLENLKEIYDNMNFKNKITKENSQATIKKDKNKTHTLKVNCSEYKNFLQKLGYEWGNKSATKRIPEFIMQANDDVVKTFLKSYFDAECHVNPKCRQIEITSASEILIYQLSLLLQRFGIICSFSEKVKMATNGLKIKRKYYALYVCGSGVEKFFKEISLDYADAVTQLLTDYKLQSYLGIKTKPNPNKEGKPVHLALKPFFDKHNLPYRLFNIPARNYIQGKRFATNKVIDQIISGFKNFKSTLKNYMKFPRSKWTDKTQHSLSVVEPNEIKNIINDLEKLKNNDLQYEKVKSVKYVDYDGYVYDLCVDETHNYISNNLICHNTVQLITAAALRMQTKNQPTLIITLKSTQAQWVNEIINVMGDAEKENITTDPLTPRKWTVVYYDNFSSGKKVDEYVASLAGANFGIVVFDELHKVKHSTSKRSQNISKVVENVPTRWGASATVSANKPMDVRNQLVMTGHHLGKVSEGKFKKDFAGYKPTGYKGAYEQDDNEDEQIKSAERLNRWLNLSGVYVRRAKKDVREMPDITVGDETTPIDQGRFQQHYATKVASYKDPSLSISKLIAARETVAHLKTDQTTSKVLGIVSGNLDKDPAASKVVVFTNFVEAGKQLVEKITQGLRQMNPSFYALTYLAETKKTERTAVKQRFTNDPKAKVLIMSMRMGGTGIDFPNAAQNMVINDFDWTPEAAEQSEGRIYRINTNHPVNIKYMVAEGIDKKLFQLVQKKRKLAGIIQAHRKEYHDHEHNAEALQQLVMAQKQMRAIDREMVDIVNDELPGAGNALGESFRSYIDNLEELRELWLYGVSL